MQVPLTATLAGHGASDHGLLMFVVTEADAAAIRTAFLEEGELSAIIVLRQRFPGISDPANVRACVRTIAGWLPASTEPPTVVPLRPRKSR